MKSTMGEYGQNIVYEISEPNTHMGRIRRTLNLAVDEFFITHVLKGAVTLDEQFVKLCEYFHKDIKIWEKLYASPEERRITVADLTRSCKGEISRRRLQLNVAIPVNS